MYYKVIEVYPRKQEQKETDPYGHRDSILGLK